MCYVRIKLNASADKTSSVGTATCWPVMIIVVGAAMLDRMRNRQKRRLSKQRRINHAMADEASLAEIAMCHSY